MKLNDRIYGLFVGYIGFPLTNYLYNRKRILYHHRLLRKAETDSPEQCAHKRLQKLKAVVDYAYEWTPYYRRRFDEMGLKPQDIQSLEDIRCVPILTREDVLDDYRNMVDSRLHESMEVAENANRPIGQPIPMAVFRKHQLVRNASTGSTGMPTVFFEDGSISAMNWAHELRVKRWFGVPLGAREIRFARLSTQFMPQSTVARIRQRLWNQLVLPGMNLSDDEYAYMLERLEAFRPSVLFGITSALTGLAEYIQRSGWDVSILPLKLLVTWAAPMFEHEQRVLDETFGCPTTNIYGTREVGHVAARCGHGNLHINEENYLVENMPSQLTGSTDDPGQLLVTPLFDTTMPFIRYKVGDLGRVIPSTCECGRKLSVITDLLGRTHEVFNTSDGRMIAPNFWCRLFMSDLQSRAVHKFQVIYETTDRVTLRIVKKPNYTSRTETAIRQMLSENFAGGMSFDFQYVNAIDPAPSGKDVMVINKTFAQDDDVRVLAG